MSVTAPVKTRLVGMYADDWRKTLTQSSIAALSRFLLQQYPSSKSRADISTASIAHGRCPSPDFERHGNLEANQLSHKCRESV